MLKVLVISGQVYSHPRAWTTVPGGLEFLVEPRAALTTHELEWLEPWSKLPELELKSSNRELVYI